MIATAIAIFIGIGVLIWIIVEAVTAPDDPIEKWHKDACQFREADDKKPS